MCTYIIDIRIQVIGWFLCSLQAWAVRLEISVMNSKRHMEQSASNVVHRISGLSGAKIVLLESSTSTAN
jgi:hypothetical protein